MISRLLHITMGFYLLVTLTGFTASVHYCGDNLVEISIDHEAESCCGDSCDKCHTENEFVKLEEDLVTPIHFEDPQIAEVDLILSPIIIFSQQPTVLLPLGAFLSESPPVRTGMDLLSDFQSFLL